MEKNSLGKIILLLLSLSSCSNLVVEDQELHSSTIDGLLENYECIKGDTQDLKISVNERRILGNYEIYFLMNAESFYSGDVLANGVTCNATRQIVVCRYPYTNYHLSIESWKLVLLHEIAHALTPKHHHDDTWKEMVRHLAEEQNVEDTDEITAYMLRGQGNQRCCLE